MPNSVVITIQTLVPNDAIFYKAAYGGHISHLHLLYISGFAIY